MTLPEAIAHLERMARVKLELANAPRTTEYSRSIADGHRKDATALAMVLAAVGEVGAAPSESPPPAYAAAMDSTLPARLKAAYARCKRFPEQSHNPDGTFTVKGDAFVAFLELRALVPEIELALAELERLRDERAEWVVVKREVME